MTKQTNCGQSIGIWPMGDATRKSIYVSAKLSITSIPTPTTVTEFLWK